MAGTQAGGRQAAKTNKERYGEDFYGKIGAKGGKWDKPHQRSFAADPELASRAGKKGGKISRRGKKMTYHAAVEEMPEASPSFINRLRRKNGG